MTTLREKIAALRLRIGDAESQRDGWRAAGNQEKYLEGYSLVEALEVQLLDLEQSTRLVADAASPQHSADAVASQMTELGVRYNGRSYPYRYDRFVDAASYARLEQVSLPTEADRALMQALAISFDDGAFRWREYRYDRLADAVAYATRGEGREAG